MTNTSTMATTEDRFQAAVNVIKGLPKNGPYQPSTAMMLKFYGLFKQATEGPCTQKKPSFWDVVGKAKWDAWNDNRHLSKEQAMHRYVEGLQEIIETMSFTENVQNFVGSLSGLEKINLDELDLISPGMRELAESHPNSPFNSRTNSPQHGSSANSTPTENGSPPLTNGDGSAGGDHALTNGLLHQHQKINGHAHENGVADVEKTPLKASYVSEANAASVPSRSNNYVPVVPNSVATVDPSDDEYDDPYDLHNEVTVALTQNKQLLQQIQTTVSRMNLDISAVNQRMGTLEQTLKQLQAKTKSTGGARPYPRWWPFTDISPAWFVLLVLWPFVVKRFARLLNAPSRRR